MYCCCQERLSKLHVYYARVCTRYNACTDTTHSKYCKHMPLFTLLFCLLGSGPLGMTSSVLSSPLHRTIQPC